MKENYKKILAQFPKKNILVVGDVMVDQYIFGVITRQSPESPKTPVILSHKTKHALGGAANVANNIVSLGGNAILLSVIGTDHEGEIFTDLIRKTGITAKIISSSFRPTTTKTRIVENCHPIVRIDTETEKLLSESEFRAFKKEIDALDQRIDFVVISDYAKGVIDRKTFTLLAERFGSKKIIADFKPRSSSFMKDTYAITPNLSEAKCMASPSKENISTLELAHILREKLKTHPVITLGEKGVLAMDERGRDWVFIKGRKVKAIDVTGAGDAITAAFALATSCGLQLSDAARFANFVASIAVGKMGVATVTPKEIKALLIH